MAKKRKEWGGLVFSTNSELMDNLSQPEEIETPDPDQQTLIVRRDAKARRGKVVTLVEGFVGDPDALQSLGKRLKSACGVGGSAKDGEIIIQGEQVDKVRDLLVSWGYKKTRKR